MKKIKSLFCNLDTLDLHIMKIGLKFCFFILILSIIILSYYLLINQNIFLFNLGISVFKLSSYISVEFIVCGFVVDKIKKE